MLRQRRKPITPIELVKDCDAFVKVENDLKEPTTTGGTIAVLTATVVLCLIFIHIVSFRNTLLKYDYSVDWDHESKLKINIDLTVATQCALIGSDVLDVTNRNPLEAGKLDEEDTWFQLSAKQAKVFKKLQLGNEILRKQYHAIHDIVWLTGYNAHNEELPKRSFSLFGSHAHLSPLGIDSAMNFSHRIDHFSFGQPSPGLVQPLNGDLKLSNMSNQIYQYFIEVVPTVVQTRHANVETYQYAVTERSRTINHDSGSHGIPGIFVRYEISPMKITVKEVNRSYWFLLVEIGGIIGGVFATSGMIHSFISIMYESIYKKCEKTHCEINETVVVAKNDIGITPESSVVI
ncbi:unnamed protein product [Didymodactylos carnosus]|uniref:Endoplasmic reticulum-Golgi intermediate compartment protein 2 n=1 Tax=Didymodactylos carnosus TaxID=1234261 RepID=A0A813NYQ3_9BILA|nr:unnamed protein product [Didymodactylos carnosus]CAF1019355.1 unnamed protein product [Didymodactylos carnosus]CAF3524394.1 unnamed protein product [Didymodactylos carnosus]CAF3788033.1 unnamed protein product [Didymodactylos carnosus]